MSGARNLGKPIARSPRTFLAIVRTREGRRHLWSNTIGVIAFLCVIIALIPLGSILWTAIELGGRVISLNFLIGNEAIPCTIGVTPNCTPGGIGPALVGTLILMGLASLIAIPLGVLGAIYLSEYGRGRFGRTLSFLMDVMSGVPSIVVGIFVYTLFLYYEKGIGFSILSGAIALAVIMLPVVTRTAEESLGFVPSSLREAAYALGLPKHRMVRKVVLRSAIGPLTTGSLLAVARAGGETAPLLFTAFGNPFFPTDLYHPVGAIPLLIYYDYNSPFSNQIADAWGATLVLILLMLGLSITARLVLRSRRIAFGGS